MTGLRKYTQAGFAFDPPRLIYYLFSAFFTGIHISNTAFFVLGEM